MTAFHWTIFFLMLGLVFINSASFARENLRRGIPSEEFILRTEAHVIRATLMAVALKYNSRFQEHYPEIREIPLSHLVDFFMGHDHSKFGEDVSKKLAGEFGLNYQTLPEEEKERQFAYLDEFVNQPDHLHSVSILKKHGYVSHGKVNRLGVFLFHLEGAIDRFDRCSNSWINVLHACPMPKYIEGVMSPGDQEIEKDPEFGYLLVPTTQYAREGETISPRTYHMSSFLEDVNLFGFEAASYGLSHEKYSQLLLGRLLIKQLNHMSRFLVIKKMIQIRFHPRLKFRVLSIEELFNLGMEPRPNSKCAFELS